MKRKLIAGSLVLMASFLMSGCQEGVDQAIYQQLQEDYAELEEVIGDVRKKNEEYLLQYEELEQEYETLSEEYDALEEESEDQADRFKELEAAYNILLAERDGLNNELQNSQTYALGLEEYVRQQQVMEYLESFKDDITYEELRDNSEEHMGKKIKMQGIVQEANVTEEGFKIIVSIEGDDSKPMVILGTLDWAQGGYEAGREIVLYAEAAGLQEFSKVAEDEETSEAGTQEEVVEMIPKAVFEYIM